MNLASSRQVAQFFQEKMTLIEVEEFWVAALNPSCEVIKAAMLFRGTVDSCFIHPRDIYRFALINNASFVVAAHNHPSGQALPSAADDELTERLKKLGQMLQIEFLDHVILAGDRYYSFAESKWKLKRISVRQRFLT